MRKSDARLTQDVLRKTSSDKDLLKALFAELSAQVSPDLHNDLDELVTVMQDLPQGLRAMAATYQLDVSMALDDLGWHFGNWHHRGYAEETKSALRELETGELTDLFDRALSIVGHEWDVIGKHLAQGFDTFADWYHSSELEATLMPLNRRWWEICNSENDGLFRYWVTYARKYPERVVP
jgi:hypothetical protein